MILHVVHLLHVSTTTLHTPNNMQGAKSHQSCIPPRHDSVTSAALDAAVCSLTSLNIGAMPFVPASPTVATPSAASSHSHSDFISASTRGVRPWVVHTAPPSPVLLPPLLTTRWGPAISPCPRGLRYVPPHEVYMLACKPKQLQHEVHAKGIDVNSISNGVSAMTLACRCCAVAGCGVGRGKPTHVVVH